jgi:hypothetical protein
MGGTSVVRIAGELLGQRVDDDTRRVLVDVVHVSDEEPSACGPAANAFVFVEHRQDGPSRARYVSWINYYDLDYVLERQPQRWLIIEPAAGYEASAEWVPFGWPGAITAPTVGDLPAPMSAEAVGRRGEALSPA